MGADMGIELYSGAAHMQALERWQGNIAHNLANGQTPGFQRSEFRIEGEQPQKVKASERTAETVRTQFPQGHAMQVFRMGEMKVTNNPYDFAVQGDGFFSVRSDSGQELYTKDGEFHLNEEGMLVNKMGYPVLNDGEEIEIRLDDGDFSVAEDGTISQNGREVSRIGVVAFDSPQNLQHGNGSYFLDSGNDAGVRTVEQPKVLQGTLQMSTVNPLREMVNMIDVSRAYELTQKMIQGEDERMEKAIQAFSV